MSEEIEMSLFASSGTRDISELECCPRRRSCPPSPPRLPLGENLMLMTLRISYIYIYSPAGALKFRSEIDV